jgi:flagellar hook-associated protein 3 FlgL
MRNVITDEMGLNLKERRSDIEDADIVEAIMNLQNAQSAYEAALGSTSKIINVSLMDYL